MSENVLAGIIRRAREQTACRRFTDAQHPGGEFQNAQEGPTAGGDFQARKRAQPPGDFQNAQEGPTAWRGFSGAQEGAACRGFSDHGSFAAGAEGTMWSRVRQTNFSAPRL